MKLDTGTMDPTTIDRPMTENSFNCAECGELIGVYEPLVIVGADTTRETSRSADRELAPATGCLYHRACYLANYSRQRR